MANEPTQYPDDVAPGGLAMPFNLYGRTLTQRSNVRQPDLGQAPKVVSISGFGSSPGGAGIRHYGQDADKSAGAIEVRAGLTPGSSGTIVLDFAPNSPGVGQYTVVAEWAACVLTPSGTQLSIAWTANRTLLSNERLRATYYWTVSQ